MKGVDISDDVTTCELTHVTGYKHKGATRFGKQHKDREYARIMSLLMSLDTH